ncbi:flagellin [Salinibacter ruber]|uniref:flagellin N-terminal helical domain-containing protein n=1 Tax=Salinibacter ruber TaxID=146919 RepID=UPI00216A1468|nr:flagellin [Salinibacter ruber]MCS3645401.1 flagellin [Salinibacter ruber]
MSSFSQINTNIQSQRAFQSLSETSEELRTRQERLTTGLRINSAEDDAAGFEIANQLEARTGAQGQALRNIGDSKSLLSTAEGSLDSQLDILQTAKEKATQAANDSLSTSEREAIQGELNELTKEVQDIAENTTFNGKQLIAGGGQDLSFQTGSSSDDTFDVSLDESTAVSSGLGIGQDNSQVVVDDSNNSELDFSNSVSFDDGGKISSDFQLTDNSSNGQITLQENTGSGSASDVIDGSVVRDTNKDNNIDASGSDAFNSDGELVDGLEGGNFELSITDGGTANSSFNVEVNGGGLGAPQTIADGNTGNSTNTIGDGGGASTVTLEEATIPDGSGGEKDVSLQLDFSGAATTDLQTAIDNNDGEVKANVQVGGEGIEFTNDVTESAEERENAISNIDSAIDQLTGNLSDLGATQNRLSFKESNLETARTNLNAAQSRIEDADFAKEQTRVAKLQVQQQSGTAQLAQANAAGQSVLSLLQ